MNIKPFKRALLVFFVLLSIGKLSSAQTYYYVTGPDHVYPGNTAIYYLNGALPAGDTVVWTCLRGRIIGQSAGANLTYCYVQWDTDMSPWGNIGATMPTIPAVASLIVYPLSLNLTEDAKAPPVCRKDDDWNIRLLP